jgi:hypothetical protein
MRISLVPCIPAIFMAAAISTPGQAAVSITDDGLTMNFGLDIQAQESMANAYDSTGKPFDIVQAKDGRSDQLNAQERRARFFVYGAYNTDWKYFLGYLVDNADNTGYKNANRAAQLFKAWLERDLPSDSGLVSTLHAGVDYPFYNIAIQGDPNWMFCNQRATGTLSNIRGEGLRYKLGGNQFTWGFDVMHNMDGAKPAAAETANQRDGLFYSTRLEVSVLPGKKPAYKESYAGAAGHSLLLAADLGYDNHDLGFYNPAAGNYRVNSLGYGVEALYHMDGLSALGEFRELNTTANAVVGAPPTLKNRAQIWLLQAGYTIPVDGMGIEPAVRYTKINYGLATQVADNYDGPAAVGGASLASGSNNGVFGQNAVDADSGLSGHQIDVGVNVYFVKHTIEMQIDYSYWKAEYGSARANIFRVQEQIAF